MEWSLNAIAKLAAGAAVAAILAIAPAARAEKSACVIGWLNAGPAGCR